VGFKNFVVFSSWEGGIAAAYLAKKLLITAPRLAELMPLCTRTDMLFTAPEALRAREHMLVTAPEPLCARMHMPFTAPESLVLERPAI